MINNYILCGGWKRNKKLNQIKNFSTYVYGLDTKKMPEANESIDNSVKQAT